MKMEVKMKRRARRFSVGLVGAFVTLPVLAEAQSTGCPSLSQLGIQELECSSCEISRGAAGTTWTFGAEPIVLEVSQSGRAAGVLRPGDQIVSIDGHLITTREGGRRLGSVGTGESVNLAVRRSGEILGVRVETDEVCDAEESEPNELTVRGSGVATVEDVTSGTSAADVDRQTRLASERLNAMVRALSNKSPLSGAVAWLRHSPISLGFGIQCSVCSLVEREEPDGPAWNWRFGESGFVVKGIAKGSPAERGGLRTGDRVVSVDGAHLSTPEGWQRFSMLEAGRVVRWGILRGGVDRTVRFAPVARGRPVPEESTESEPMEQNVLRFDGTIGGTRVEVRGPPDVVVELDQDSQWAVIRVGEYEIRVRATVNH